MFDTEPLSVDDWRTFLTEYDQEKRENGTGDAKPCDEGRIRAAEQRLNCTLPPSMRNFYLVSNGWEDAGIAGEDIFPVEQLEWLRESDSADLITAWADVLDEEELAAVQSGLLIAYGESGDYWLLQPPQTGGEAEWTAYEWEAGGGGSPEPHESFGALLLDVRRSVRDCS